ncbi:hypothetical protein ACFYNO_32455 [Kitasatospora sp. NPDC006697]|uniref:hypothetical protein n=1 Tax=Kitasatospora sp. NPDC006697 TaxID=3364020 RepID=UPI0036A4811E
MPRRRVHTPVPAAGRRQRVGALAAAGAVLAQLWGLGVGVAHAADGGGDPVDRAIRAVGADSAGGPDAGALPLAEVDDLLRDRIRAGGLPLPGQAAAVPDAFAIAAVLLPAVPAQPGSPRDPVRERQGVQDAGRPTRAGQPAAPGAHGSGAGGHQGSARAAEPGRAGPGSPRAGAPGGQAAGGQDGRNSGDGGAAVPRTADAASRDAPRPLVGLPRPVDGGPALLTAPPDGSGSSAAGLGRPVAAAQEAQTFSGGGVQGAVLIPIAAGLLLTGAAMYKHRGLPKGH